MFPFVHPAIALAALGTGLIPVLIHLIHRRRYQRVPWAAMSFLLAAARRSAKRVAVEHWLLLLVRIVIMVLLGFAVARPYLPATAAWPLASARSHRVLIVDNSLSMNAAVRGTAGVSADAAATRFDQAKKQTLRLLESFPAHDSVSVVTLASPAEALLPEATSDRRVVREVVASIKPTQRAGDTAGGLSLARDIVASSHAVPGNRFVYLITDAQQGDWSGRPGDAATASRTITAMRALADALEKPAAQLIVYRGSGERTDNVSLTELACATSLVRAGQPIKLQATVTNHGTATIRDLRVQFMRERAGERAGEIIRRQTLPRLGPGETNVVSITTALPITGSHMVKASVTTGDRQTGLAGDALKDDDSRFLSVEARSAAAVLLVDGLPGVTPLAGEAGYLATALAPGVVTARGGSHRAGRGEDHLFDPHLIAQTELDGETLADFSVVVLCNVQRLTEAQWQKLSAFVADGGGLLVFSGDRVDPENYNRFGYRAGQGVLPGEFVTSTRGVARDGDATALSPADLTHPVVLPLADHPQSGVFAASISQYSPLSVDASRGEVILRYTDGGVALVASRSGNGRVLMCTTTAGMGWSNLPAKGDFVSLALGAVTYLTPLQGSHRNILVGESVEEPLTPLESTMDLRIRRSDASTVEARLVPRGDGLAMMYGPAEHAGRVDVLIGAAARPFAVNVDPAESALASLSGDALMAIVDRPMRVVEDAAIADAALATAAAGELAPGVLWVVLLLLMLEMGMALWFGSHR